MRRPLNWSLLIVLLSLPLQVYFGTSAIGGALRVYQYQRELETLRVDLAGLEQRRQELVDQQLYLQSDQYIEKVAREELGLVKPGDQAVVIVPGDRPSLATGTSASRDRSDPAQTEQGGFFQQVYDRFLGSGESRSPAARRP